MNGSGGRTLLTPPPVNAAKEGAPTEADARCLLGYRSPGAMGDNAGDRSGIVGWFGTSTQTTTSEFAAPAAPHPR